MWEQEEYKKEGIDWTGVTFADNKPVLVRIMFQHIINKPFTYFDSTVLRILAMRKLKFKLTVVQLTLDFIIRIHRCVLPSTQQCYFSVDNNSPLPCDWFPNALPLS